MKKISIDLTASKKGERKKVVRYLRNKGLFVPKRSDELRYGKGVNYLSNNNPGDFSDIDFHYYEGRLCKSEVILTLPLDWDKLVEIVESNLTEAPVEKFKEGELVVITRLYHGDSFNVGDTVRLLRYPICDFVYSGKFYAKGMSLGGWFFEESLEKATPEHIERYLIEEYKNQLGFL